MSTASIQHQKIYTMEMGVHFIIRKRRVSSRYIKTRVEGTRIPSVPPWNYKPLRKDVASCSPSILSINRQLHQEGYDLIYGEGKSFKVVMNELIDTSSKGNSKILDICYDYGRNGIEMSVFPSGLCQIQSLDLIINHVHDHDYTNAVRPVVLSSGCLTDALAAASRLKNIRITVRLDPGPLCRYIISQGPKEILEMEIKTILQQFERLRDLKSSTIQLQGSSIFLRQHDNDRIVTLLVPIYADWTTCFALDFVQNVHLESNLIYSRRNEPL